MEILEHTTHFQYFTRFQARKMVEDQAAKIKLIDKTQQEMQEKMINMMDMMKNFMKGKGGVGSFGQEGEKTIQ